MSDIPDIDSHLNSNTKRELDVENPSLEISKDANKKPKSKRNLYE